MSINPNSRKVFIGDRVNIDCGSTYGMWGGCAESFIETGIKLISDFRGISETSMEEIIDGINKYSPIEVIEQNREGQNNQLVIFIPWFLVEKIVKIGRSD